MSHFYVQSTSRLAPALKISGGIAAVGVHLLVIGMVLFSSPTQVAPGMDDTSEIHFVELSDIVTDVVEQAGEQAEPELVTEPESVIEPEPEPVIEPEPEPEPEPVIEPEPAPEVVTPPPPPEPKPKPKPKPKPVSKPSIQEKPQVVPIKSATPGGQDARTSSPASAQASAPPTDQPRMVSTVDYLGRRPMPVYPRASQRRNEQGRVLVRVLISPQGTVLDVSVRSSSGFDRLDEAALKAARSARFRPYTENGIAYRAMADLPFDFVL